MDQVLEFDSQESVIELTPAELTQVGGGGGGPEGSTGGGGPEGSTG